MAQACLIMALGACPQRTNEGETQHGGRNTSGEGKRGSGEAEEQNFLDPAAEGVETRIISMLEVHPIDRDPICGSKISTNEGEGGQ